jgi:hypothetical protein
MVISTVKILILSIFIFTSLSGCGPANSSSNIYNAIPKRSALSKQIFINSEQVYPTDSFLVVLYNLKDYADEYNVHLLFWDKRMNLAGAAYFAAEEIDSISGTKVYGVENIERSTRKNRYIKELPGKYRVTLLKKPDNGQVMRYANKIITGFKYKSALNDSIIFYIAKEEKDNYAFLNFEENDLKNVPINQLAKTEIAFNLSDLLLDYRHLKLSSSHFDNSDYKILDEMLFANNAIRDSFFNQTWSEIQRKISK